MADNGRAPSLSQNSENEILEHTPMRFTTLSSGSSVVGEASKDNMIPLANNANSNSNFDNNNGILVPTPTPAQPSSGGGYHNLPREQIEELAPPSSKRPRGRPLGSKNKPKPFVFISEDDDNLMKSVLIKIPEGNDVVQTLINVAQHRNANVSVLSGYGPISDVTLRQPMSRSPIIPFQGPYNMTSLTGTYVNANCGVVPPQFLTNPSCSSFAIHLSNDRGQVIGGIIGGKVISAGPVVVHATLFNKPKFHRVTCVNGIIEEFEENDPRHTNVVITNADCAPTEPNNNNNRNNTTIVSDFAVAGAIRPH